MKSILSRSSFFSSPTCSIKNLKLRKFILKNAENGKICIICTQSSLYRDLFPQGVEKFGSLKREFVISGVRYMKGFYEGFLRGKRRGTEFGS